MIIIIYFKIQFLNNKIPLQFNRLFFVMKLFNKSYYFSA